MLEEVTEDVHDSGGGLRWSDASGRTTAHGTDPC